MSFQTVEQINAQTRKTDHLRSPRFRTQHRLPEPHEVLHVAEQGCLTHITRHVSDHWKDGVLTHSRYTGWCGTMCSTATPIPAGGEFFGCHKCIERAQHFGQDTFLLIPSNGCEMTDGQRWQGRP